jgi:hypothetical protein
MGADRGADRPGNCSLVAAETPVDTVSRLIPDDGPLTVRCSAGCWSLSGGPKRRRLVGGLILEQVLFYPVVEAVEWPPPHAGTSFRVPHAPSAARPSRSSSCAAATQPPRRVAPDATRRPSPSPLRPFFASTYRTAHSGARTPHLYPLPWATGRRGSPLSHHLRTIPAPLAVRPSRSSIVTLLLFGRPRTLPAYPPQMRSLARTFLRSPARRPAAFLRASRA